MRKKEKPVAFQFYPRDYLSDINVEVMTIEEEGIYIRLLSYCWLQKRLPNDPDILRQLSKGASAEAIGRVVRTCFQVDAKDNGKLFNARLELERKKQKEWSQKSSEGGKKSGKIRRKRELHAEGWLHGGSRVVQPNGNSSSSSSFSSSTAAAAALPAIVDQPAAAPEPSPPAAAAEREKLAEYPTTSRVIADAFPGTDGAMVTRIVSAACRGKPDATDAEIAAALIRTLKRTQRSAALWLKTLPAFFAARASPPQPAVCPECGGYGRVLAPEFAAQPDSAWTDLPHERTHIDCPRCRGHGHQWSARSGDTLRKPAKTELEELVLAKGAG